MRIAIIGPGILPIPPHGWGAVENIIHEYDVRLSERGWTVLVINTRDRAEIVRAANEFDADIVHCQYDEFIDVLPLINTKLKIITSHFGYILDVHKYNDYLHKIHLPICRAQDVHVFCLSPEIRDVYIRDGAEPHRVHVLENGVSLDRMRFAERPDKADRSIFLGKVDFRKRQGLAQKYSANVDFAGNLCPHTAVSSGFDPEQANYLGEWSRNHVQDHLTDYASLVLLSDGEAHALVCMEALAAGLGLVLSEYATANLDLSLPFIDVIPESRIRDDEYVRDVIERNRAVAVSSRAEIRAYSKKFDWGLVIEKYERLVGKLLVSSSLQTGGVTNSRIAVLTVATGPYFDFFFRRFADSIHDRFLAEFPHHIFCFTDTERVVSEANEETFVPVKALGWPFDSLLRFSHMQRVLDRLDDFDNAIYIDVDMLAVAAFDPTILTSDLFAVSHPGFHERPASASFEIDWREASFVPPARRRAYCQGCLWGGRVEPFKDLINTLSSMVRKDLEAARIPVWHDESYLNWYLSGRSFTPLHPGYAQPEKAPVDFPTMIIHLSKHDLPGSRNVSAPIPVDDLLTEGFDDSPSVDFFRALYLKAHEKTQFFQREILAKNFSDPPPEVRSRHTI